MANKTNSLSSTTWMCKYHIVFIPKYRRKGEWKLEWNLGELTKGTEIAINENLGDSGAKVDSIILYPASTTVYYNFPMKKIQITGIDATSKKPIVSEDIEEPPTMVGVKLKDGTVYTDLFNGGASGYENGNTTEFVSRMKFSRIIDIDEIESLLFLKEASDNSYYKAAMFVDASGDSDLLHYAGVPTVTGGNYHTYLAFGASIESCKRAIESNDIGKLTSYYAGGGANLYGGGHPEGMKLWDGTNGDDVSRYLKVNQLELLEKIKGDERNSRDITLLPIMPQFRTTRHIDGNYTLQTEDAYRHFDDSVCAICDFERRDFLYEIPYATMVRDGFDNVIAAGRCVSAEGYAWDVVRVIPPAILTGQAAGAAVSLAIDTNCAIADINTTFLQSVLSEQEVLIHFDDALVPEDKETSEICDIGHI